jgi:hypothetical protein
MLKLTKELEFEGRMFNGGINAENVGLNAVTRTG